MGINTEIDAENLETEPTGEQLSGETPEELGQLSGETPEDEPIVTIGEESQDQDDTHGPAPEWVKDLRRANREDKRRIRELEAKLAEQQKPAEIKALGAKPTLEGHDYDTDAYEQALTAWYEQKRAVEDQAAKKKAEVEAGERAWQAKVQAYATAKSSLKFRDFDDAEVETQNALSATQQGIILQGAENPALVVYALGKNPSKLRELSSIEDPVKYAFAVAKLESQLKVTQRKAPAPERTIGGTGTAAGAVDSTLERLRAEAEKTGDYSKVSQYRRQQRNRS